jgi:hypothetical protein
MPPSASSAVVGVEVGVGYGRGLLTGSGPVPASQWRAVGDLPVEVVTRHRLTIDRRVVQEIGLSFPPEVLARADQVIE